MKKLGEMDTDELMDVLLKLTPELMAVLGDSDVTACFSGGPVNGESTAELGVRRLSKLAGTLLGKHRERTYSILAVLSGKTAEEIRKQPASETVSGIKDVLSDRELLSFFG